jgi:hypothetical protein
MVRAVVPAFLSIALSMPAVTVCASDAYALTPSEAHALLTSPARRVRGVGQVMTRALADGVTRSATFARLVRDLNHSDVFVYVESAPALPPGISGRMMLLEARRGGTRYVRVQVRANLTDRERIALVAHELRHALEVADSPGVQDEHALVTLYRQIGTARGGSHQYDTEAAQQAGRRVRQELVGS